MTTITRSSPCLPCCFQWEDTRNQQTGKGGFKNCLNKENFGVISQTDSEIRFKMLVAFFGQPLFATFIRIPYRICALIGGDFFKTGYKQGLQKWHLERQIWSLADAKTRAISPPGTCSKWAKIAKYTLWQLIKNIIKIVTYPIAIVAMQFTAVYGLFVPLDGVAIMGKIEHLWARDTWKINRSCSNQCYFFNQIAMSDYNMPCMQSKQVWGAQNLYRMVSGYRPDTIRSLLFQVERTLQENQQFFDREGVPVQQYLDRIQHYRQKVKKLSQSDQDETSFYTKTGKSHLESDSKLDTIRFDIQHNIWLRLLRIKALREQIITDPKNPEHQTVMNNQPKQFEKAFEKLDAVF